ncbi:MAG: hypothetical protein RIM99_18835 [Cyclobacteriaceae bacterium]
MRHSKQSASTIIGIAVCVFLLFSFKNQPEKAFHSATAQIEATDLKRDALKILQTKCNICHVKKNPGKVFTLDNMSALAPKIQKQVFVKKRMPKGNKIHLTEQEYIILKKWLRTQLL